MSEATTTTDDAARALVAAVRTGDRDGVVDALMTAERAETGRLPNRRNARWFVDHHDLMNVDDPDDAADLFWVDWVQA